MTASSESKANFKTPSRRDSLRRSKALQAEQPWAQLTTATTEPAGADVHPPSMAHAPPRQSAIVSQSAYVPLPTQHSTSSIQSGFTPGGPIPNNFSYLTRSNSLATSTRPNRPKGLEHSPAMRSSQLPHSPMLSASVRHPKSSSLQHESAPTKSGSVSSPSKHRASASLDMDEALQRTLHARPPSVEDIFAELDAAETKNESARAGRVSSPVKGSVSRRAAEYVATLSASDSEPAFSTMRRVPLQRADLAGAQTGTTEPRKPGAIMPIETPAAERVLPRRSKTLSNFPPSLDQASFHEQRSKAEKAKIAELVAQLPVDPKTWSPSQVAVYLSHVLGLTPRPIVEDVTAFVRAARMNGNVFLRLREHDLASAGVNRKWQKLMLESGKALRRDCVKCNIWGVGHDLDGQDAVDLYTGQRKHSSSDEGHASDAVVGNGRGVVDIAALRAGYLKVAPTAVSAMRGSVRKIRDRQAVKGMIKAFETWRTEADLSETDEDAFVALGSHRARHASSSGSIDSSNDEDSGDEDDESVGSTRSVRRRETESIRAIYGAGFVRRRAESYSSLSDAENESQARLDADIEGDRSISRARAQARRQRMESQKADDELVNAWIESLTDEEAQALANELEAKEVLDRGLLKPLIETATHTRDVSDVSSGSTGSVRDDLKILLGSVNQTTLARHNLLSIVPTLDMDGELSDSPTESPLIEKKELEVLPVEEQGKTSVPLVSRFTPVSEEVLLAIFADTEEETSQAAIAIRNAEIDKQIDRFLGIRSDASATVSAQPVEAQSIGTPGRRATAASRYADDGNFDTTRRKRDGSQSGGLGDLKSLFSPTPAAESEDQHGAAADEVHATVKPNTDAMKASKATTTAHDDYEISPNGSIRRRQPTTPSAWDIKSAVREEDEQQAGTIIQASSPIGANTARSDELPEFQPPSVRDIFGPMFQGAAQAPTDAPAEATPAPAADIELPSESTAVDEEVAPNDEVAVEPQASTSEPVEPAAGTSEDPDTSTAADAELVEEADAEISQSQEEDIATTEPVGANVAPALEPDMGASDQGTAALTATTAITTNESVPSIPSLTASKLPTPTLQAKGDVTVDLADISGLDLADFEPIEPGGEKVAVPLTTLVPAPDGKGSIRRRSMVLVDRRRFESLARRMGVLEEQLASLETATEAASSSYGGSQARASGLRSMFEQASSCSETSFSVPDSPSPLGLGGGSGRVSVAAQTATIKTLALPGMLMTESGHRLSYLEHEFAKTDVLDEDAELLVSDEEGGGDDGGSSWATRLSFGAIPSYMLGLGAGIGFVLVSEVIQRATRLAR